MLLKIYRLIDLTVRMQMLWRYWKPYLTVRENKKGICEQDHTARYTQAVTWPLPRVTVFTNLVCFDDLDDVLKLECNYLNY